MRCEIFIANLFFAGDLDEIAAGNVEHGGRDVPHVEPGKLLRMEWVLGRPVRQSTGVSVRFEPRDPQSCRITLTHENWERMGEEAGKMRNAYDNGWATVFEQGFGDYAGRV